MNDLRIRLCLLSLCYLVLFSSTVWAGIDSNIIKTTQNVDKVFERMLMAAEEGDMDQISKAVVLLEDLNQQIESTMGVDIKENITRLISNQNTEKITAAVQQSIYHAITYLMQDCFYNIDDKNEIKARIKNAYKLYLLLDYYLRRVDFEAAKVLKNKFRLSNSMVGVNPDGLGQSCIEIKKQLKGLLF